MVNILFFSRLACRENDPFKPCTNITMFSLTKSGLEILFCQIKVKMLYNTQYAPICK